MKENLKKDIRKGDSRVYKISKILAGKRINLEVVQDIVSLERHYFYNIYLKMTNGKKCLEALLKEIKTTSFEILSVSYNKKPITFEEAVKKIRRFMKSYNFIVIHIIYTHYKEEYILQFYKESNSEIPEVFYFNSFDRILKF